MLKIVSNSVAYPLHSTPDGVEIAAFRAALDDGRVLDLPSQTLTGLTAGSYFVLWDLTAQTVVAVDVAPPSCRPDHVIIGQIRVQSNG